MLYFKVIEVTPKKIKWFGKTYSKCRVEAGRCEIAAYICKKKHIRLEVGMILESDEYALTNERKPGPIIAALRIDNWDKSDTTEVSDDLIISAQGHIVKSKKVELKYIGKNGVRFIPVTFVTTNEDNEKFILLTCGFGKNAKIVSEIEHGADVELTARVKKNRRDATFELSISEIKILNGANSSKEELSINK